jgi:hypothetical protein
MDIDLNKILIVLVLVLFALTWAVLIRYMARRREYTPELARMRFNLKTFFGASLPPVGDGANMRVTEGFVATTRNGKLDSLKQTRTVSREI